MQVAFFFFFYFNCHYVRGVQIRSFFWSLFSRIRTEYGEMWSIFPYSVRMRENTDLKKLRIWTLFMHCVALLPLELNGSSSESYS